MDFCVLHLCFQSVETAPKLDSEKHGVCISTYSVFKGRACRGGGGVYIYIYTHLCMYICIYTHIRIHIHGPPLSPPCMASSLLQCTMYWLILQSPPNQGRRGFGSNLGAHTLNLRHHYRTGCSQKLTSASCSSPCSSAQYIISVLQPPRYKAFKLFDTDQIRKPKQFKFNCWLLK